MREMATLVPLVIMVFFVGVYPAPLMELLDASVASLVEQTAEFAPVDVSLLRP